MSSNISYEEKFASNFNDFMAFGENILKQCYEQKTSTLSPSGISYAIGYANGKVKDNGNVWLIESFITKTSNQWDKIKERDTDHFSKNMKTLLPILEDDHIKELARIFTSTGVIDDDDKDAFWEFIESFVKLSINYVHTGRKPEQLTDGSFKYTNNYFPNIKVKSAAESYKVKLK
jgi:hypothetical protein